MRRLNIGAVLFVSLFLFTACSHNKSKLDEVMQVLPVCDSLSVTLGSPSLIQTANGKLYVDHSFSEQYNIDVIDVERDSILYSFAKRGQGPNEFLQITSMDVFQKGNRWFIQLYDNLARKLAIYSIDSLDVYKEDCLPIAEKKLPASSRYLGIYEIEGNRYIATGRTAKKFSILDSEMNMTCACIDYPKPEGTEIADSMILSKADYGRLYFNADRTQLASVVFMSGTMSVFDVKADSVVKAWDFVRSGFEYKVQGKSVYQLSPTGYLAASFTSDYVIGLYSGEQKKNETNYAKEFHFFDNAGNLSASYTTASRLYNFCVDAQRGLIYAISYEGDPCILIYRLPD